MHLQRISLLVQILLAADHAGYLVIFPSDGSLSAGKGERKEICPEVCFIDRMVKIIIFPHGPGAAFCNDRLIVCIVICHFRKVCGFIPSGDDRRVTQRLGQRFSF